MSTASVNSQDYWNDRFDQDWEANLGRNQSRFFAKVALDNMPDWFKSVARAENWTICDWGCAQGDGTDLLADHLAPATIVGVDFAHAAIEKARADYGRLRFETQDWIADHQVTEQFDVVFSSNTLEHFSDPFAVLTQLFKRARNCVVLALPYRELDRISEHFFTFTGENVPLIPHEDWTLVHGVAVDCRTMEPTYWRGEQVLLVYGRRDWITKAGLALADVRMQSADDTPVVPDTPDAPQTHEVPQALATLAAQGQRLESQLAELTAQLSQHASQNEALQARNQALQDECLAAKRQLEQLPRLQAEMELLHSSLSWRLTKPLRALSRLLGK